MKVVFAHVGKFPFSCTDGGIPFKFFPLPSWKMLKTGYFCPNCGIKGGGGWEQQLFMHIPGSWKTNAIKKVERKKSFLRECRIPDKGLGNKEGNNTAYCIPKNLPFLRHSGSFSYGFEKQRVLKWPSTSSTAGKETTYATHLPEKDGTTWFRLS